MQDLFFSPLSGEDFQFDEHMGWNNRQYFIIFKNHRSSPDWAPNKNLLDKKQLSNPLYTVDGFFLLGNKKKDRKNI